MLVPRLSLALLLAGLASSPLMVATGQVSPARPARPAAPPRPERPERIEPLEPLMPIAPLAPIPVEPLDLHIDVAPLVNFELDASRFADIELRAQDMALRAQDMANLDVDRISARAEILARGAEDLARRAAIDMAPLAPIGPISIWGADALLDARPRAPWAQDDPADSLYRIAREALNRGEYRRAAQLFADLPKKFPKSQYAQDSAYWEAFARYRLGGSDDLKQALAILDKIDVEAMMRIGRETTVDLPALRTRIQGALAARGDKAAEEQLRKEAATSGGCDREAVSVRAEALGALGQMDMQAAMPAVKKVLANRDECTVELRRRALYLVARQPSAEAASMILDIAKNDPDDGLRSDAMRWLPQVSGENAIPQIEELLRATSDEQTQRAAVRALASIDGDRARKAVRALIERDDVSERVRYEAVVSLLRERDGRQPSADDIAYLRSLYGKLTTPRLREAVLVALSRVESADNTQFLLSVARNENESAQLRAASIQRLGRMQSVSAADIARLYDGADARALREQILYALAQRKEPEAIDKMMEIARKDTDPQIRRTAITLLARSNNERAKQLLQELVEKP